MKDEELIDIELELYPHTGSLIVEDIFNEYQLPIKDFVFLRNYLNDGIRQRDYYLKDKIDSGIETGDRFVAYYRK